MHTRYLEAIQEPHQTPVVITRCEEAELDEMGRFVVSKAHQRWLWHAIDHRTGEVLAYGLGTRKDDVFERLKALLEPFGIQQFYPMIGVPMSVIWIKESIRLENTTPENRTQTPHLTNSDQTPGPQNHLLLETGKHA